MPTLRLTPLLAVLSCSDPTAVSSRLHDRWFQPQQDQSYSRPVVAGNLVIFGTGDGFLIGRNKATGAIVWRTAVGEQVQGERLVARDDVVVASLLWTTVGVNAMTGDIRWTYRAPIDTVGGRTSPGQLELNRVDADNSMAFIPAWGASVSAVDLASGAVRWVWQPGRAPTDTAVSGVFRSGATGVRVSGDTVYARVWHFLVANGVRSEVWMVALDKLSGHELWRVTVPSYWGGAGLDGAPAVYGSFVIFNEGGHEYAIDARTQRIAWDFPTTPVYTTVSESELYGDIVYHDGGDHNIYALQAATGALVWKAPIPNEATQDLLVTDRRVIFPNGLFMDVLDRSTGKLLVDQEMPDVNMPISSPASWDAGQIFVNVFGGAWSFTEP